MNKSGVSLNPNHYYYIIERLHEHPNGWMYADTGKMEACPKSEILCVETFITPEDLILVSVGMQPFL